MQPLTAAIRFRPGPRYSKYLKWCAGLCGVSLFLAVGLPTLRVIEAQDWSILECQIVQARKSAKRVRASYTYQFEGRSYKGTKIDFGGVNGRMMWLHHQRQFEAVREGRPGPVACYVDPADPSESVILREFSLFHHVTFALFFWGLLAVGPAIVALGQPE